MRAGQPRAEGQVRYFNDRALTTNYMPLSHS